MKVACSKQLVVILMNLGVTGVMLGKVPVSSYPTVVTHWFAKRQTVGVTLGATAHYRVTFEGAYI